MADPYPREALEEEKEERAHEPPTFKSPPNQELGRTTSTGTWGEIAGEPINVAEALALARSTSRQSARVNREPSRAPGAEHKDIEEGEEPEEEHFDLANWLDERIKQSQEEGKNPRKALGVAWRDLTVLAPANAGGRTFVKTLPVAITNTAWRDPWGIITSFIPALGRLTTRKSNLEPIPLIQNHAGLVRAGEMLLVLGRPGSGCSTTLRALTSSLPRNLSETGMITYGGIKPEELDRYRGEVIFVDEDDLHFSTITVAQTLRIALRTKVPRSHQRLHDESRSDFIEKSIDVLLKMFGMSHVRNTIVGDSAVRGVSGGERKRVTIMEALASRASVVAWDNSTRGLDASTALEYAKSLRILTDLANRTTIATLYQVAESIFNLFDRVAVVDEGRLIYYGPRDKARTYFHELGYFAPERMTTADFVTAVTDPVQVQYREGFEQKAPRTAEERQKAWLASDLYRQLDGQIEQYERDIETAQKKEGDQLRDLVHKEKNKGVRKSSAFTVPFREQVAACIYRQVLLKWHSRGDLYTKFFTIIGVSLMVASQFYKQASDSSGAFTRGGVILFAALFNGWLQLSEAFDAVAGRPMLARHKQFAFYRPSAVVISRAIVDIPLLALQCTLSSIIIYFLANLRVDAGAFFIFLVYTFLSAYNLTMLYRLCAALSPGFNEAIRFAVLTLNILIVFIGYVIHRSQMNWMIFLSYINGISYAFEGFLANEFNYDIACAPSQIVPFGEARDVAYQTCALTGSTPGSIVVPSADYLSTTFGYSRSHIGRNVGVLIAFSVLYLIPTIYFSEKSTFGESNGGLTIFARTKAAKKQLADDEAAEPRADDPEAAPVKSTAGAVSGDTTRANSSDGKSDQSKGESIDHSKRPLFTWQDVSLELPDGRKLLQEVDGYVQPGTLTALMGQSGAGKTTLMGALSQRNVAGALSGDILLDGKPLGRGFQKGTGLVLQQDMHLSTQTVREAVEFSAILRQPAETSREDKLAHAQHVIDLLELNDLADAIIGVPGAGLGVEKAKRVSIAVELAAKPDLLLFLDEPTSGLDSAGAAAIVRLLRRLAEEGQAILCTVHQPSVQLFEAFDNLVLLAGGGQPAIVSQIGEERGKGSKRIRDYFESKGAPKCAPDGNVAEWMLEVVSGSKSEGKDWGAIWRSSEERKRVREDIVEIVKERKERPDSTDSRANSEFSADAMTQIKEVTLRQFRDVWRNAPFAYGILFSNFVTGFVAAGAFAKLGYSTTDFQNRVFICFLIILNLPAVVNSIVGKTFEMRVLFEVREAPSKVYAWYALVTAIFVSTIPVAVLASVFWFLPTFFIPLGSRDTSVAGYFYLMTLLFNLFGIQFAFMLSVSCPTPVTAANLLPFILPILALVNGVIVPHGMMPNPWRDFVYWVNPITHFIRGQLGATMHGLSVVCSDEDLAVFNPPPNQTCDQYAGAWATSTGGYLSNPDANASCGYCQYSSGDQYLATLNAPYDFRWQSFGIFLGYVIFNTVGVYACWWYFRHKGYGIMPKIPAFLKRGKKA